MDTTTRLLIVVAAIFVIAVLLAFSLWLLDMTHRWGAKSEAKLWKEKKKKDSEEMKEAENNGRFV